MEILIVGGIIVLLMVAVSTKIKQSAAEAFVPEFVETDEFAISKPEGFMSPLNDESGRYIFEARSREYGEKKTRNIWQAHAFLTAVSDSNFQSERERVKKSADKITSERILNDNSQGKICLLEIERAEENIALVEFYKIVESRARHKIYNLQISVLPPFRAVYIERVNEMIDSFGIK